MQIKFKITLAYNFINATKVGSCPPRLFIHTESFETWIKFYYFVAR